MTYKLIPFDEYCNIQPINISDSFWMRMEHYYFMPNSKKWLGKKIDRNINRCVNNFNEYFSSFNRNSYVNGFSLEIYQCDDEWFYLKINTYSHLYTYKCDQVDGVIDCLTDLGKIVHENDLDKFFGKTE